MQLSEETIEDLKQKHGDKLIAVSSKSGDVLVFRAPKRLEYDRWMDTREEKGTVAAVTLAKQTIVHPGRDELMRVLEEQPAILMCKGGIFDAISMLAGLEDEAVEIKKL